VPEIAAAGDDRSNLVIIARMIEHKTGSARAERHRRRKGDKAIRAGAQPDPVLHGGPLCKGQTNRAPPTLTAPRPPSALA